MSGRVIGKALARAAALVAIATLALGVLYPFAVGAVGRMAFPWQAQGSIIEADGVKYGSAPGGAALQRRHPYVGAAHRGGCHVIPGG